MLVFGSPTRPWEASAGSEIYTISDRDIGPPDIRVEIAVHFTNPVVAKAAQRDANYRLHAIAQSRLKKFSEANRMPC